MLCTNYASNGFSCVTKDNCPNKNVGSNSIVFPRNEEKLDAIFREEIKTQYFLYLNLNLFNFNRYIHI